jgi:hypothetical protein
MRTFCMSCVSTYEQGAREMREEASTEKSVTYRQDIEILQGVVKTPQFLHLVLSTPLGRCSRSPR